MRRFGLIMSVVVMAAGCGGGGGDSHLNGGEASPTGIWEGTIAFDSANSVEAVGLVAENGQALLVTDDGQMIWGSSPGVDGNTLVMDYHWALPPGARRVRLRRTLSAGAGAASTRGSGHRRPVRGQETG